NQSRRDAGRDRQTHRMRGEAIRPRPHRLGASRLRLLDAAALGRRPQNRSARRWARPLSARLMSEHSTYRDRVTGALVHQMTNHPSINHSTYFLQSSFTPDGHTLIFTSYRTGAPQLFAVDFPEGEIRQLTEGPA